MSNICDRCGKSQDRGNLVSHAKNRTKTLRKPNLHRANLKLEGIKVKLKLCTKCLRMVRKADKESKKEEK